MCTQGKAVTWPCKLPGRAFLMFWTAWHAPNAVLLHTRRRRPSTVRRPGWRIAGGHHRSALTAAPRTALGLMGAVLARPLLRSKSFRLARTRPKSRFLCACADVARTGTPSPKGRSVRSFTSYHTRRHRGELPDRSRPGPDRFRNPCARNSIFSPFRQSLYRGY